MKYTPAMQQYIDIKKEYKDCILFFRLGDFYEVFFEDAKLCSKALDLVLTSKNKNSDNPIPMAGVPYHSAEKYVKKLIAQGYKVAIAEQTTDPVPGKIVEREVVSVVTPGTYIQESQKQFTYMVSIVQTDYKDGNFYHIARGDFSIGQYWTKSFDALENLQKFILMLNPAEIILDIDFPDKDDVSQIISQYTNALISVYDLPPNSTEYVLNQCKIQTLASYGKSLEEGRLDAFALLLHYIKNTQKTNLTNISRVALHSQEKLVLLDDVTIKNLELLSSSYEGSEKYSLIGILDTTKTAGGARLLRYMLTNPINDYLELQGRLNHIEYYLQDIEQTKNIHHTLGYILDIPKIVSSLLYRKLLPSTFVKLRSTFKYFFDNEPNGDAASHIMLQEIKRLGLSDQTYIQLRKLYDQLVETIKEDEDVKEDMNFIQDGISKDIDELREIAYHSDELLMKYQQELAQYTGVNNVKLKFIMNQGYFIEVTNKDVEKFDREIEKSIDSIDSKEKFSLQRRNTLKGAQRYTSPYLDEVQIKILQAKEKLIKLEFDVLEELKEKIGEISTLLHTFAEKIAHLDIYTSHAISAQQKKYVKPQIKKEGDLDIKAGKHPVIEEFLPQDQQFIPNDLEMMDHKETQQDSGSNFLHIITGPNMGGKSTFLRQNALIVLMAHCGFYVPAKEAQIPLVDGIFARVGSGDVIAKNQSTFMTEMIEVANILNNATHKSFVIFDELGRGTSTYDGLALTKSILEYIAKNIGCKTLIATHYHELIALEGQLPGVKNFSVSVYETDKEVVFMKKIVKGGASKSYGIDVAKIAGIPQEIVERAIYNLQHLEINGKKGGEGLSLSLENFVKNDPQFEKIKNLLKSYDLDTMTPLQALQLLAKIKDDLR